MSDAILRVEIHSDLVCPWCAIGLRRFARALAAHPDCGRIEVVLRPFQLDPRAPAEPRPVAEVYARKFGGTAQARRIIERVTAEAAGEGLAFRLDQAQRANTADAHRLLWWAYHTSADPGAAQWRCNEAVMDAYFCQGGDIADIRVLAECARRAGLDPEDARSFLAGPDGRGELQHELLLAAQREVHSVPTFIFMPGTDPSAPPPEHDPGNWFTVPGAQPEGFFARVLDRLSAPDSARRSS